MALTPERIDEMAEPFGNLNSEYSIRTFAQAIEAEVCKDYDALIRQMLDALENLDGIDTETECVTIDVSSEITAARARLGES